MPGATGGSGRRLQEAVCRHGGRGAGLSCGLGGPQPPGPRLASLSSCGSQGTERDVVEAGTWRGPCGPGELRAGVPQQQGRGGHGHRDAAEPGAGSCWVSLCPSPLAAPAAPEAPIYFCMHQPSTLCCSFPSQSAILNKIKHFNVCGACGVGPGPGGSVGLGPWVGAGAWRHEAPSCSAGSGSKINPRYH